RLRGDAAKHTMVSERTMTQPSDIVAPVMSPGDPRANGDEPSGTLRERGWSAFRPTSAAIDAGLFTWDIVSGEGDCDAHTYRMHGLPDDRSATMETFLSRVPESDLPQVLEVIERMTGSIGSYQIEYRVRGPGGDLRTMEARGRVLPGDDGSPAKMTGVVVDITSMRAEREADQQKLREVADRARRTHDFTASLASALTVNAIIDAAKAGISAYGADSLILVAERDGQLKVEASYGLDDDCVDALSGLTSNRPAP